MACQAVGVIQVLPGASLLGPLALVCLKQGDEATALEKLQAALDLAEPGGWIRNFMDLGLRMTRLLERLTQARPDHGFAHLVLAVCKAEAQPMSSSYRDEGKKPETVEQTMDFGLTRRETELLPLLAEGLSKIARSFRSCPKTAARCGSGRRSKKWLLCRVSPGGYLLSLDPVPEANPRYFPEMLIPGDNHRPGFDSVGGDPDIIDRQWCARLLEHIFEGNIGDVFK